MGPGGEPISSTRIRSLVAAGRVEEAAVLLGRPHQVRGKVVHGDHRGGRRAGLPHGQRRGARPASACRPPGIYAGWYERPDGSTWKAAISVGRRPTFYGAGGDLLVEAYLLDFAGDLYGEEARVSFVAHLRDELAFDSVEELIAQMDRDVAITRERLTGPGRPGLARRLEIGWRVPEELGSELPLEHLAGRVAGQGLGPEPEPAWAR